MSFVRLDGWELRLAGLIEEARMQPYVLGSHDCFKLACKNVEALSGVDLWSAWQGRYHTQRQALRLLAEYGGTFDEAGSKFFKVDACAPSLARRGDVLKYVDAAGAPHLGVCMGSRVAVMAEHGLTYIDRSDCELCWRIG